MTILLKIVKTTKSTGNGTRKKNLFKKLRFLMKEM